MTNQTLSIYTVYYDPADFPEQYVARRFYAVGANAIASDDHYAHHTIEAVRAWIRAHSFERGQLADHCQEPHPSDDSCIVENWL